MSTPLHALGTRTDEGWVLLRDVGSTYRDGGEERVYEILSAASDLSSGSDELVAQATSWAEHYHLSPMRANLLRALDLPADATVLEIGAGCGAVTRYLGETCAVVDALEPVPARAKALRERTRDLDNVQVFVGELDDVPAEAVYDLVVVVGVLEYVGNGSADLAPYHAFLNAIHTRLRPGGSLVLAIENKLGAKYFAGAAEDHTNRYFDGIEGYPTPGPARTFSRRELTALLAGAGFDSDTVLAFPDYKLPRALLDPSRLTGATESLLYRIPTFPSPDWSVPREFVADERRLWKSLVQGGLAADTGNSFVALAGKGGKANLWPADQGAAFYSRDRRSEYTTQTRVRLTGDGATVQRTLTSPAEAPTPLTVLTGDAPFVPGTDLIDVFVDTADETSRRYLVDWKEMLEAYRGADSVPLDLVPHNLVVSTDGRLVAIDDEWRRDGVTVEDVLRRGSLLFAVNLALRGRLRPAWVGSERFRDVALAIGAVVGLSNPAWLDKAVREEAELQSRIAVIPEYLRADADLVSNSQTALGNLLNTRLDSQLSFGQMQAELRRRADTASTTGETVDSLRHELHLVRTDAGVLFDQHKAQLLRANAEEARADAAQHRSEVEFANAQRLAARVAELEGFYDRMHREVGADAERTATTAVLRAEVEKFRNDVRTLSNRLAEVEGELDRTRKTLSWRVTAPLRWVRRGGRGA